MMSKKLEDNIVDYGGCDPTEITKHDMEGLQNLRVWAMKTMRGMLGVLAIYGLYAFIFSYVYSIGGFSALFISVAIVIIYSINRVIK